MGIPITTRVESRDIHRQYFDIIGTIPGQDNHNIWGSLHFLQLVSNVFLPRYDSGTFLSHLAEGEYGFDIIGSNCIDMYQMYVVVPTLHHGNPYVGVGRVEVSPLLMASSSAWPPPHLVHRWSRRACICGRDRVVISDWKWSTKLPIVSRSSIWVSMSPSLIVTWRSHRSTSTNCFISKVMFW